MTLKHRFLEAIVQGKLGRVEDGGIIITLKEFKAYFKDIKSQYVTSFLPASTIEIGQQSHTHTRFVFRIRKGVYRLHPQALEEYMKSNSRPSSQVDENTDDSHQTGPLKNSNREGGNLEDPPECYDY